MRSTLRVLLPFLSLLILITASCRKDELLTDSSAKLEFSTDTVLFDTVFATVGSTTRIFKIYNSHSQPLNISTIRLATGSSSQFRINVDGISAVSHSDVEIAGGDSMYVFVQVTINPTGVNAPLLVRDSVIFETNGNIQDVKLVAIGQDVYLHKPNVFPTNGFPPYSVLTCPNTLWTNDKPHLVFGYLVVDTDCELQMQPGTRVYMHNNSVLWVYEGTLKILGAPGNEVTIQGDRLEQEYKDLPGQWGMIWLGKGSKDNVIDWAIIKNGGIGIRADSLGVAGQPLLQLNNTIIKTFTGAAVYGLGSHIRSYNCVFANCGQYVAALTLGGKYKFEHCTFANYWDFSTGSSTAPSRSTPTLAMSNYYIDVTNTVQIRPLDSCYFGNCIVYGNLTEEIGMDSSGFGGAFNYKFENSLIKTARATPTGSHYQTIVKNQDPAFKDKDNNDYRLNSGSNARNKGTTTINIPKDLSNADRPNVSDGSIPDAGAYEFY